MHYLNLKNKILLKISQVYPKIFNKMTKNEADGVKMLPHRLFYFIKNSDCPDSTENQTDSSDKCRLHCNEIGRCL